MNLGRKGSISRKEGRKSLKARSMEQNWGDPERLKGVRKTWRGGA